MKHHIVQKAYLKQWLFKEETDLNVYIFSEKRRDKKSPGWKGFWRKDYNILYTNSKKSYLPEEVTSYIDRNAIEVIKKLNTNTNYLEPKERSYLSHYVALQNIRTPRYRDLLDRFINQVYCFIKPDIKKYLTSDESLNEIKKDLINLNIADNEKKNVVNEVVSLPNEKLFEWIDEGLEKQKIGFKNSGHSKHMLGTLNYFSKVIFNKTWLFCVAPGNRNFITSDSPCLVLNSKNKCVHFSNNDGFIFFPLRPDICLVIPPEGNSTTEQTRLLDEKLVSEINDLIFGNAYSVVVSKKSEELDYFINNL